MTRRGARPPQASPAGPARGRKRGRGGAAARARATRPGLPYLIVLAGVAGSLVWVWQGGLQGARGGTFALAGAVFAAALARLVLPEGRAGMLASRGRLIDVVTLAALAIGLLVAGLLLPTPS